MPQITPAQQDFVADYAAKRAAQMERARAIKNLRDESSRGSSATVGGPNNNNGNNFGAVGGRGGPTSGANSATSFRPSNNLHTTNNNNNNNMGGFGGPPPSSFQQQQPPQQQQPQRAMSGGFAAPPPLGALAQQQVQQQQQQPQAQSRFAGGNTLRQQTPSVANTQDSSMYNARNAGPQQLATPAASNAAPGSCVTVSEDDFRRAVSKGIISQDQCRQLWVVLSAGASTSSGNNSNSASASSYGQQQRGNNAGGSFASRGGGHNNNSNQYSDDGDDGAPPPNMNSTVGSNNARNNQQQQQQQQFSSNQQNDRPPNAYDSIDTMPALAGVRGGGGGNSETGGIVVSSKPGAKRSNKPVWNDNTGVGQEEEAEDKPLPDVNSKRGAAAGQQRGAPGAQGRAPPAGSNRGSVGGAFNNRPREDDEYHDFADEPQQQKQPPARGGAAAAAAGKRPPPPARGGNAAGGRPPPPARQPSLIEEDEEAVEAAREEEARRMAEEKRLIAERLEQEIQETAESSEPLLPCGICGRNFRQSVVDRHERACEKSSKKRKEYDMTKHRADGVEGLKEAQRLAKKQEMRKSGVEQKATAMPKWKAQHLQFQAAMNAAHGGSAPAMPVEDFDDRIGCPSCGRKFAKEAAERHIPKCNASATKPRSMR